MTKRRRTTAAGEAEVGPCLRLVTGGPLIGHRSAAPTAKAASLAAYYNSADPETMNASPPLQQQAG